MDRAYYKQLNQVKREKEKRLKREAEKQRAATIPSTKSTPPPLQMVQPMPERQ